MATLVNLDGALVAPADAKVSVLDRGFLYGDSVYEVVRTYGERPFELDAHLARLARSAERTGLAPRWDGPRTAREIARTLEAARAVTPGHDIYALEAEWRAWWSRSGRVRLRSPDRAFLGWLEKRRGPGA
jgi:branched-subunit amino acid aminotransferase/4-amino-4-deoxychorismate lyase